MMTTNHQKLRGQSLSISAEWTDGGGVLLNGAVLHQSLNVLSWSCTTRVSNSCVSSRAHPHQTSELGSMRAHSKTTNRMVQIPYTTKAPLIQPLLGGVA